MPTPPTKVRKITTLLFSILCIFLSYSFQIDSVTHTTKSLQISQADKDFILTEKDIKKVEVFLTQKVGEHPELSERYYQWYLSRGTNEKNDQIQFISYYYLSDLAYGQGDYALAIKNSKLNVEVARKQKLYRNQITALNQLGNAYYQIRNYDNSLNQYLSAYEIAKANNDRNLELQLLSNINNIRTRIHRYEDALVSYKNVIDLLQTKEYKNIPNYSGTYLSNVLGAGVCNFKLKKYDKAIEFYNKGFQLAEAYNSEQHIILFHLTTGEAYTAKKMYNKALEHINEAKESITSTETTFNPLLHTANFHLATIFFKKKDYKKSLDCLSESFELINSQKNEEKVEKIHEMYDLAFRLAEKLNDKEKQLKYSKAYRHIIDSLHLDDNRTKDRLYDQDITELEAKNQELSTKNILYILITVVSLLVILGLSIYNYNKQQKNKKLFEQLQEKQERENTDIELVLKKEFITDEKASALFKKLNELEGTDFYLKEDCSLYTTAKLISTNTSYLSKIMNEYRQKSFNDYINELRINKCMEKLKTDKKFQSYTIKAIAGELGYKSVNTFASAFKKQTGLTHSFYIKQILKKDKTAEEMNAV